MKVHIHNWSLSNGSWKCLAPDHIHNEPDILDAATAWHVLGVINTHQLESNYDHVLESVVSVCDCGWTGHQYDYYEHLDDAIFYWLRDIESTI